MSSSAARSPLVTEARPLIVGIGGTEREGSVTEACVREALAAAEFAQARAVCG
ncbi:MAG: hypothetical protein JWN81_2772 [Solirubrobacterales bacterium]|jgi:hypothetical protein|nr:hypothetical protein [Solirubrobacterales bacterium]